MTRLAELLRELVDIGLLLPAVPELVEQQARLAAELEQTRRDLHDLQSLVQELYVGSPVA